MTRTGPRAHVGVVVGKDLVGDALYKLPFTRALRVTYPEARITWITTEADTAYRDALRDLTRDLIDDFAIHVRLGETVGEVLRGPDLGERFDVLIDTRGRWKGALAARRLRPRLFVCDAWRFIFSDRRPAAGQARPRHVADRLELLLRLAAGDRLARAAGGLDVPAADAAAAAASLPDGACYVGFAPGAGNPVKIWPLDRFLAVAAAQPGKGRVPVFLLGPDEAALRPAIGAAVPDAVFPLDHPAWGGGPLGIARTVAVGRRLAAAIVNDSGTSHMLAAAGCPLVSLFGPTDPGKLAPRGTRVAVVAAQRFGGAAMDAIPADAVADALDALLEREPEA